MELEKNKKSFYKIKWFDHLKGLFSFADVCCVQDGYGVEPGGIGYHGGTGCTGVSTRAA